MYLWKNLFGVVEVTVKGPIDPVTGMVMNIADLKEYIQVKKGYVQVNKEYMQVNIECRPLQVNKDYKQVNKYSISGK